ncbi:MAG TPA: indole-3-glycerol-phosphate synthase [Methanoculleus sp.]|nr:indole-3-glycerol-phosphate synthase [Methanoculleus sp.]
MNDFLNRIIREKEKEAAGILLPDASGIPDVRQKSLRAAVRQQERTAVIAEIKFRSPSGGAIAPYTPPKIIAGEYLRGGCTAISVLTDGPFFGGKKEYLADVAAVSPVPVLRKDFIVDERQIIEAKVLGADAVLLIGAIAGERLGDFHDIARGLSMEALVEVRTTKEADLALSCGAEIIGINNRDLRTMAVSLETTAVLSGYLRNEGHDGIIISESGYRTPADIVSMHHHCDGFLIGSALMASGNRTCDLRRFVCA